LVERLSAYPESRSCSKDDSLPLVVTELVAIPIECDGEGVYEQTGRLQNERIAGPVLGLIDD
jgi:hypothetical protein